jgi:lysophospholipase
MYKQKSRKTLRDFVCFAFKLYFMNIEDIQSLLTPPDNWQWGEFQNHDNQKIRYGFNTPDAAKALIVIAPGRTEVIEEYFEIIRDLNAKGFACSVLDWQGQGGSYRYNDDNSRHHSMGFDRDVGDFKLFLDEISHIDLPKILMAHSMGGNITLRYLIDYHDTFTCAYFIAPMLGLQPKRTMTLLSSAIIKTASKIGWLNRYALGQRRWNEIYANIAKYKVSSDKVRREKQPHLFRTQPELQCGGVTWGWLKEALDSIKFLHQRDNVSAIQTPCFFGMAGRDAVVDNDGTMKTASYIKHAETHIFKRSEHQIHAETDNIRNALLQSFHDFVEKHLSSKAKDC